MSFDKRKREEKKKEKRGKEKWKKREEENMRGKIGQDGEKINVRYKDIGSFVIENRKLL